VVRLSNILQERERELAHLHTTVEGQCAERHQLIAVGGLCKFNSVVTTSFNVCFVSTFESINL
jgi:hypothetical protein